MSARDGIHQNMRHENGGHHDSHRTSKHTVDYKDLTQADSVLLAPIVAPIPPPTTSAGACYHDEIKKRIADLPAHLQAKYPLITSSCSTHRKANEMPLQSMLNVIQDEVSFKALRRWSETDSNDFVDSLPITLLQDLNAIWLKPEHFRQTFGRDPSPNCIWSYLDTKCVVCKLGHVAQSGPAVTALGALTIAGLRPENWKKSKRMFFFVEWLRSCVEFSYKQEPAILTMWECGTRLRAARDASKLGNAHGTRNYIDNFVAQVKSSTDGSSHPSAARHSRPSFELHPPPTSKPMAGPSRMPPQADNSPRSRPVRPARSLRQEDHIEFTNAIMQQPPDECAQTPTSVSSTARLIRPPLQEGYAPFATSNPYTDNSSQPTKPPRRTNSSVRMTHVQREFYAEAKTLAEDYKIPNPFDDGRAPQDLGGASARPQGLSVERPARRIPIPSSIYSRPQTAVTIDEDAVIEIYKNGGLAGPSSRVER